MIGFGPIHILRLTLWQRSRRHQNLFSERSSLPGAFWSGNISLQWSFKMSPTMQDGRSLNKFNVQLEESGPGANFLGGSMTLMGY